MNGIAWADTEEQPPAESSESVPTPDPSQLEQPPSDVPAIDPPAPLEGDFSDEPGTDLPVEASPAPEPVTVDDDSVELDPQEIADQGNVVERSEYEQTFEGPNGSRVTQLSLSPLNVEEDGEWVPIETDVQRDGAWAWMGVGEGASVDRHPLAPQFSQSASDPAQLTLQTDDRTITFGLKDAASSSLVLNAGEGEAAASHVEYRDVFPDTDVLYDIDDANVKENLRVGAAPGAEGRVSWQWTVNAGDLKLKKDSTGSVSFVDASGETVFFIPTPIAHDSSGVQDVRDPAFVPLQTAVLRSGSTWVINVSIDRSWMNDPARVYPVMIDPSVSAYNEDVWSFRSDGYVSRTGDTQVGNNGENKFWRSMFHFNYEQLYGKQVIEAQFATAPMTDGGTAPVTAALYWATSFTYENIGEHLAGWYQIGTGQTTVSSNELSNRIAQLVRDQQSGVYLGLRSDDYPNTYTRKVIPTTALLVLWKDYPTVGSPASPANGATQVGLTPTLSIQGATTGQINVPGVPEPELHYHFKVAASTEVAGSLTPVFETDWVLSNPVTIPATRLQPGTQYCWWYQVRDSYDGVRGSSTIRNGPTVCFTTNDVPITSLTTATPSDRSIVTGTTPTLSVQAPANPNNRTMSYWFRIVSGGDATTGAVVSSGWRTGTDATTWTVPAGYLLDGVSYTWTVMTKDQYTESGVPWVGHLTVNQRISDPGPAPVDTAGPVTVNLANGNAGLSFTSPTVSTVGGPMGMSFVYNSLKTANLGLRGEYFDAKDASDQAPLEFTGRTVTMTRPDSVIDFNWGYDSPTNGTSGLLGTDLIPKDNFLVRWSGYLTLPAGTYYFGATGDDGFRAWIGNTQILNQWSDGLKTSWASAYTVPAGGAVLPFKFEYYERLRNANIRFLMKASATAADSTAVPVNPAWFSRTPATLPNGWGASNVLAGDSSTYVRAEVTEGAVNLVDGFGGVHAYGKTSAGGYTPPAGERGVVALSYEGLITFTDEDGTTYTFNRDGTLSSATAPTNLKKPAAPIVMYRTGTTLVDRIADPLSVVDPNATTKTYARAVIYRYSGDSQCVVDTGFAAAPTGMLCRIEYPDGSATNLMYNTTGYLVRIVNPGNAVTTFGYDSRGRVNQIRNPFLNDWLMASPSVDAASPNYGISVSYDAAGKVQSVTQPVTDPQATSRMSKTYTWGAGVTYIDVSGLTVPAGTGSDGHAVKATYNALLQTTSMTTAEGLTSQTGWNAKDRKLWTLDPQGEETTTLYDSQDRATDSYGPAPASCFPGNRQPSRSCAITPAHSSTKYDEGLNGLDVQYWDNGRMTGAPKAETLGLPGISGGVFSKDFGSSAPISGFPTSQWSLRAAGLITFPATGQYRFNIYVDDAVRLYIDDVLVIDNWTPHSPAWASGDWKKYTATAGQQARIRIEYGQDTGGASVVLHWWRPGASTSEIVPGQYLTPNYGLPTSSTVDDSSPVANTQAPTSTTTTNYGTTPWLGLVRSTVVDPGGLALNSQTAYESDALYNRVTASLSPADEGNTPSTNGVSNTYWSTTATTSGTTCGVPAGSRQWGLLQTTRTSPSTTETGLAAMTTSYVYDIMGRVAGVKKAGDTNYSCTTYDARGRVISATSKGLDLAVRTTTYGYTDSNGDPRTTWIKDDKTTGSPTSGKITTITDLLGRVTSTTDVWGTVTTTTYNALGQVATVTTTAGSNTYTLGYTYSLDGRVETVTDGATVVADPTYATGALASVTYGNGTSVTIARDLAGRQVGSQYSFAASGSTTPIASETIKLSQSGRTVQSVIVNDAETYTSNYNFDKAGRLITAYIPGHTLTYGYSASNTCGYAKAGANGNRTTMTDTPTGAGSLQYSQQYCYDKADRLLTEDETITGATTSNASATRPEKDLGTGAITYDAHGNVTKLGDQTFTYDSSDRHTKTTLADGTTVTYVRDVSGNITARTEVAGGVTTTTRYSGGLVLDGNNSVIQRSISLPGAVTMVVPSTGSAKWAYANLHGDITWITDNSGVRTDMHLYDPFGQPMDKTTKVIGSPVSDQAVPDLRPGSYDQAWLGGRGKGYEHAGSIATIEMGARMYAPWLGQFLAQDPIPGGNTSRYNYPNDPVNMFDLDGKRQDFCGKISCNDKFFSNRATVIAYAGVGGPKTTGRTGTGITTTGLFEYTDFHWDPSQSRWKLTIQPSNLAKAMVGTPGGTLILMAAWQEIVGRYGTAVTADPAMEQQYQCHLGEVTILLKNDTWDLEAGRPSDPNWLSHIGARVASKGVLSAGCNWD